MSCGMGAVWLPAVVRRGLPAGGEERRDLRASVLFDWDACGVTQLPVVDRRIKIITKKPKEVIMKQFVINKEAENRLGGYSRTVNAHEMQIRNDGYTFFVDDQFNLVLAVKTDLIQTVDVQEL